MTFVSVVGGRPHLVKAEAVHRDLVAAGCAHVVIRVGLGDLSDYPADADFDLPKPIERVFARGSGDLCIRAADALRRVRGDVVFLYGDLLTTHLVLPGALRSGMRIVHLESGYRSRDLTDVEERTRIVAAHAADVKLAFNNAMVENLLREGIRRDSIGLIPNPAQTTLLRHLEHRECACHNSPAPALVTFHHDETLHDQRRLRHLVRELSKLARDRPLQVVLYRRTARYLRTRGLLTDLCDAPLQVMATLSYRDYVAALRRAPFVVTDSSGLQDDCAALGVPCLIVRRATSRPTGPRLRLVPLIDDLQWDLVQLVDSLLSEPPDVPHDTRPRISGPTTTIAATLAEKLAGQ